MLAAGLGATSGLGCAGAGDPEAGGGAECVAPESLEWPVNGACPTGHWLSKDEACNFYNGGWICSELGDNLCYPTCQTDADCVDPCRPHCAFQQLHHGIDVCASDVGVYICSDATELGCLY